MTDTILRFPGCPPVRAAGPVITGIPVTVWDEPAGCTTPRGWLIRGDVCVGFYLDYGPEHYRTGHITDVGGGRMISFCRPGDLCRECQPGNILACRYPGGPGTATESRYVVTLDEARRYVETGTV